MAVTDKMDEFVDNHILNNNMINHIYVQLNEKEQKLFASLYKGRLDSYEEIRVARENVDKDSSEEANENLKMAYERMHRAIDRFDEYQDDMIHQIKHKEFIRRPIFLNNARYDELDDIGKKSFTLEDYLLLDRDFMSDEDKVGYVSMVRESLNEEERALHTNSYNDLWMTGEYDNTLDVDVMACDAVLQHRYSMQNEEQMTNSLDDSFEKEENNNAFEPKEELLVEEPKEELSAEVINRSFYDDNEFMDLPHKDLENNQSALNDSSKMSDYTFIFDDSFLQEDYLGKVDEINNSNEKLSADLDKSVEDIVSKVLSENKSNDISVQPYELQDKDTIMSNIVMGLSTENNEYVTYMADTRTVYSLGNDVTKICDEINDLSERLVSGVMVEPLYNGVDTEKIEKIYSRNENILANSVENTGDEVMVLQLLAEQKKINMQQLSIVGQYNGYDSAYLVDSQYNRIAILDSNNKRGIIDNSLGEACKIDTPKNLKLYADADLVLHNNKEITDAVKSAKSVLVDDERCSEKFGYGMLQIIYNLRNGKGLETLSASDSVQCYFDSGPKHRVSALANHKGKSMNLENNGLNKDKN